MRTFGSILLLVGVVLQLLLGTVYLMSGRYQPIAASTAGDTPPGGLSAEPRLGPSRQLTLGVALLGGGLCGLVAALMALRRPGPPMLALALCCVSVITLLGAMLADGPLTAAVVALCLVALALAVLLLARRRAGPREAGVAIDPPP